MADTLSLRERLDDETIQQIIRACPNNATWEEWTEPLRAAILAVVLPVVEQAIQQARDESEAEIATLQRALEAWAARERAADRVREAISKKGHGDA